MLSAIALIDANNFYVSCERVFNAKLKHQPVVVLSNNDGCIISRSNESKALGVKMGEPFFKARPLLAQHEVQVFSSNYELYGDMSARVMEVLQEFSDEVEIYSIDEAFVGLQAANQEALTKLGREIKEKIYRYTGVPVSVGIAENKTLAKVAAYHAKRSVKANGVLNLAQSAYRQIALQRTPVEEIWGIGRRYAKFLNAHKIETAEELIRAQDDWIRQNLTVVGLKTVHELRGTSCFPLELTAPAKQSITVSRSFGHDVESFDEVREAIAFFTARAGEKLRRQQLSAASITVFLQTNRFKKENFYSNSASFNLSPLTDSTPELMELAQRGIAQIFRPGFAYKKAGLILNNLQETKKLTLRLLDQPSHERMQELMKAVDRVNAKHGKDKIQFGAFKTQGKWRGLRGGRSSRFTTNWQEILTVT